jgi:cytoskeleton protein RodZ
MSETNDVAGTLPEELHTLDAAEVVAPVAEAEPQVSAGQMLREARLASGMHIGTLSLALKVPVKKLEALEADDWAQLPDAVFVRALATSVCRQIKADSAPILAAMPQNSSTTILDDKERAGLNQPFRSPNDAKFSRKHLPSLSMPMIAGAAVLLLAALLLIFLPDFVKQQNNKKAEVIEKIEPVITPEPVAVAVGMMVSAPIPTAAVSTPVMAQPAPTAATPIAAVINKPAVSAPVAKYVAVTPAPVASTPTTLSAGTSILRLAAKGEVWVQVKDSKGMVLVQRNLQPKEIVNVSGIPPLSVVLGRVNEIESVVVRGKPFNLAPVSSENIARFEVK